MIDYLIELALFETLSLTMTSCIGQLQFCTNPVLDAIFLVKMTMRSECVLQQTFVRCIAA